MIRTSFSAFLGLFAVLSGASQSTRLYSTEPFVIRHANTIIDMNADGTGDQTETMVVAVQSEAAARQFSVISTFYAKQSQRAEFLYLRVRHPDGTTVETPRGEVQDQAAPVTQQAPFYSDLMIKQLPVKGLRVGDTVEWQTHTVRTTAEAPGQFWGAENFTRDAVIEDQTIELRVPLRMKVMVQTKPESKVQLAQSEVDGRHVYHWSSKQLAPTVGPQAEALKKTKEAQPLSAAEQLDATEGALPDIAWTTFPDWQAVGAWYRGLEGDRQKPDEAVRAKVAEITAGKTTQEEKIRAVYASVSGQIRYVGVALGVGRYQPHTASAVLDNQYGDCKDKHTLLAAMLLSLGLEPDAVLAGPGIRFNRELPSPASFNHLITRVAVDGKEVWLDSTSEVAGYRVLLPVVRDKDVLVVPQTGPATIAHTPADLPFKPESTFAVAGSLDGALASDSTIAITHHDDMEVLLRAGLRQVSPSQYEEVVQRLMENYGFGGKVSQVAIEQVGDPSVPLTIRFRYHRDWGEDWGKDRVTAIFGPTLFPAIDKKDLPHAPLQLGPLRADSSTVEMKLPQGWNAELPEAIHQHRPYADCDVTYRRSPGSLFAERRVTVLQAKVSVADMRAYAEWYEACGAGGVPYVQLVKGAARGAGAVSSGANQVEAELLVRQANNAIREGKYDEAEVSLKQVQALDSKASDLWGDLGAVAMHRGNQSEAMRLYAKEMELHPEAEFAYMNLAGLQSLTGDDSAAGRTLTRWQRLAPANPVPSIMAVEMLLNKQDNAGALKQAKAFALLLDEGARKDERYRLILGEAEMRGGDLESGEPLMVAIAKESPDLGRRNDASYELASAGRDLPLAEATERSVLDQLTAESRAWTGGEAQMLLRQKSSLMTAGWDTLGWVLFKEGKAAEAEAWIRPAMAMRQNAEVGEHLGDVLMAQTRDSDAALAYAEALASLPPTDALGVRNKVESPRAKALRTKLDAARAAAKMSQAPDGRVDLQQLRTWKLGASDGLQGNAEFMVLLSSGGVASALPIGAAPHAMQERIEAAKWSDRYPPGVDARLAAKVMLKCFDDSCQLVLEP